MSSKNAFWRLLAKESLYMLLLTLIGCGAVLLQTVFKKNTGVYSGAVFSGSNYQYNPFMYILGIFIFVLAAFGLYAVIMGKDHALIVQMNIYLKLVTWAVLVLWGFVMMFAEILSLVGFVMGLTSNLLPESMMWVSVVGWPAFTLVFLGFMTYRILRRKE